MFSDSPFTLALPPSSIRRYEWYEIENTPRTQFVKDFEASFRQTGKGDAKKAGAQKHEAGMTSFRLSSREIDEQYVLHRMCSLTIDCVLGWHEVLP